MIFPKSQKSAERRMVVEGLSGGYRDPSAPTGMADNQVGACCNMWWYQGALRTRPAFRVAEQGIRPLEQKSYGTENFLMLGEEDLTPDGTIGRRVVEDQMQGTDPSTGHVDVLREGLIGYDGRQYWQEHQVEEGHTKSLSRRGMLVNYPADEGDGSLLFCSDPPAVYRPPAAFSGAYENVLSEAYVPLVVRDGKGFDFGKTPNMPATNPIYEGFNLLTPQFRAQFSSDGVATTFRLPESALDNTAITVNYRHANGYATFTLQPDAVLTDVKDGVYLMIRRTTGNITFYNATTYERMAPPVFADNNIEVYAAKTVAGSRERICRMRIGQWFAGDGGSGSGTRLFVAGNPACPNLLCWSEINEPLYFPRQNYAYVGDTTQSITALQRQGSSLVIFKQREIYYTTYDAGRGEAKEATRGEVVTEDGNAAYFPLIPLHARIGCDCPDSVQLCGNRLVWAVSEGQVYMLVGNGNYSYASVCKLSAPVEALLGALPAEARTRMAAGTYDGRYLLLCDNRIFLFDYDTPAFESYVSRRSDETAQDRLAWYLWDLRTLGMTCEYLITRQKQAVLIGRVEQKVRVVMTMGGEQDHRLAFAAATDALPQVTDTPIVCGFATKLFDFGCEERHKTVVEVHIGAQTAGQPGLSGTFETPSGRRRFTLTTPPAARVLCPLRPHAARVSRLGLTLYGPGPLAVDTLSFRVR